jgi:peptidoglycan/xylan/chitin deacetylase (PgdA/CDA1 family)
METTVHRRNFLGRSFAVLGAATSASFPLGAFGQTATSSLRRADRYQDTYIFDRKPFRWPGGKRLAIWVAPAVEVWSVDKAGSGPNVRPNPNNYSPDVMNYSWREYGIRIGLWRMAEAFDEAGIKATVLLNSKVCEIFPKAVEEMNRRGWEFVAHGATNSETLAGLDAEKERDVIRDVAKTIEQATGKRPRGWLGAGLVETHNTLDILADEGFTYCGDWGNDDQPYPMKVKKGKLYSLPYTTDVNDGQLFARKGYTGDQYFQSVMDHCKTLLSEGKKHPRVVGLGLHPMLTGQPLRIGALKRAISELKKNSGVWFATGSEIIDAYRQATGS